MVSNSRGKFHPPPCAVRCGNVAVAKFSSFEPGKPAIFPTYSEWPRYHEQVAFDRAAHGNRHAIVIRFRMIGIILAPINRVHQASLGGRVPRRHSEIGVATEIPQQQDFIVEAAPPAIRPRIIQRPVSMDEPERQLSIALAKQAVLAIERPAKTADSVDKILAAFAIVMQM